MAIISSSVGRTKTNKETLLRSPTLEDAEAFVQFKTMANSQTDYIVTLPEEFSTTLEGEKDWIQRINDLETSLAIIAEIEGQVVGMLDFHGRPQRKRLSHTGHFGMIVASNFRNQGVGNLLISTLIQWVQCHPTIRKIGLAVFSTNLPAIHLYQKLGFKEEGHRVREIQISPGQYIDDVLMYRWVDQVPS